MKISLIVNLTSLNHGIVFPLALYNRITGFSSFFGPQNLIWNQKPNFFFRGGIILLTFCDPSNGFGYFPFWQHQPGNIWFIGFIGFIEYSIAPKKVVEIEYSKLSTQ